MHGTNRTIKYIGVILSGVLSLSNFLAEALLYIPYISWVNRLVEAYTFRPIRASIAFVATILTYYILVVFTLKCSSNVVLCLRRLSGPMPFMWLRLQIAMTILLLLIIQTLIAITTPVKGLIEERLPLGDFLLTLLHPLVAVSGWVLVSEKLSSYRENIKNLLKTGQAGERVIIIINSSCGGEACFGVAERNDAIELSVNIIRKWAKVIV